MIGRVYRGGDVGGLLRYLYGPGRHNEHVDPRLVAGWDLTAPAELATLEPPVLAGQGARAMRDFGPLTGSLELATALRHIPDSVRSRIVWHCPLRLAPGDRVLSDAEWGEVARDVLHRTGIAPRGDDGGCRWIAVRHDEHSVHLVAVLARQDGAAARVSYDHLRVREACRAAEQRLGLTATAPADRTAATHTTRAEVEKARRTLGPAASPDRAWLRDQVQLAALQAPGSRDFLDLLCACGVLVRQRTDADGRLTGYAVARRGSQEPVFYGGGKLAPDLTLPRLQARWQQESAVVALQPASLTSGRGTPVERAVAFVTHATTQIHQALDSGDPARHEEAAALVYATAHVVNAAARAAEGPAAVTLRRSARAYDRASREPSHRLPPVTPHSRALQDVARSLLIGGRLTGSAVPVLLAQVLLLVDSVRQLREAQGRLAQAQAAQRAGVHLRRGVQQQRQDVAGRAVAGSTRQRATTAAVPLTLPSGHPSRR